MVEWTLPVWSCSAGRNKTSSKGILEYSVGSSLVLIWLYWTKCKWIVGFQIYSKAFKRAKLFVSTWFHLSVPSLSLQWHHGGHWSIHVIFSLSPPANLIWFDWTQNTRPDWKVCITKWHLWIVMRSRDYSRSDSGYFATIKVNCCID